MNKINFEIESIYPGAEMLPFERSKVYDWIINVIKPEFNILEIGTGVGGSTYYLSKSLLDLNSNLKVYTCDPTRKPTDSFLQDCTNVSYFKMNSNDLIKYIVENNINISYLFFDGPEPPEIAINDIKILEKYIKPGCYFSMHDWEIQKRKYDNGISTKSLLIRPYIENSSSWKEIEILEGIESDKSVGLCLYMFLGID